MVQFETRDGKLFYSQSDAQTHANNLAKRDEEIEAKVAKEVQEDREKIINAFNIGDWDTVIGVYKKDHKYEGFVHGIKDFYLLEAIAYGKKGDCKKALFSIARYENYTNDADTELKNRAIETLKQALSNEKGRNITEAEYTQYYISLCKEQVWYDRDIPRRREFWEEKLKKLTGKKNMSGKSGSSSSSFDKGNMILSILFGIVGGLCVIGIGNIFAFIPLIGKLLPIVFLVLGFIFAFKIWRNKDSSGVISRIIKIGILCIAGLVISSFGGKQEEKIKETANASASATITSGCNFRSGPSTNDAVIRGLSQGDKVTLTGEAQGGWTKVSHNGDIGWVSTEFLGK